MKIKKVKPVYYLIQLIDLEDPSDQRQQWFLERQEVVIDLALARAIGF